MPSPPEAVPGRRPQAERSRASRNRILDAAIACLVEDGYARTNTLTIQARAGVSRGRLLHQFPSKDELLVAAAHHVCSVRLAETEALEHTLPSAAEDRAARIDAVILLIWQTFHLPHFWAATELWVAARTEPALAEVIRPAEKRLGRAIWATADSLFGPELAAHPLYPTLRQTLFTSMRGVALTYAFDARDTSTEPAIDGWRRLARAVLLGEAPPG
ncbi:MAG TPA: TetR/AcrR family transcriptional regulator [Kineosporiaceae bacterium]